jgi:hypothetical protein
MKKTSSKTTAASTLTTKKMLQIVIKEIKALRKETKEDAQKNTLMVMQEIVDVRRELKEEQEHSFRVLNRGIDSVSENVETLQSEVHTLRLENHHNQATFIKNHDSHEKRITLLEEAAV